MGQIVGLKAKPKRCNLNKLSQLGTPAAGEYILVSYDNSMTANGQGNFDRYIIGDGRTAATALELKYLDDSTRPYIVEEVNKAVADIQPIEITGDVTNAPDEEDLTSENQGGTDVLKFKDKAYNSALYSGLGRVYLRKNIVTLEGTGKNVLTQAMVNTANTIYHIQYDYDLNGQTITLPAGCVLEFDGGSLANGTLIGNNTIISDTMGAIFKDTTLSGTYILNFVRPEWFALSSDTDDTASIQRAYDALYSLHGNDYAKRTILLSAKNYNISPILTNEDGAKTCLQFRLAISFRMVGSGINRTHIYVNSQDVDSYAFVLNIYNDAEFMDFSINGNQNIPSSMYNSYTLANARTLLESQPNFLGMQTQGGGRNLKLTNVRVDNFNKGVDFSYTYRYKNITNAGNGDTNVYTGCVFNQLNHVVFIVSNSQITENKISECAFANILKASLAGTSFEYWSFENLNITSPSPFIDCINYEEVTYVGASSARMVFKNCKFEYAINAWGSASEVALINQLPSAQYISALFVNCALTGGSPDYTKTSLYLGHHSDVKFVNSVYGGRIRLGRTNLTSYIGRVIFDKLSSAPSPSQIYYEGTDSFKYENYSVIIGCDANIADLDLTKFSDASRRSQIDKWFNTTPSTNLVDAATSQEVVDTHGSYLIDELHITTRSILTTYDITIEIYKDGNYKDKVFEIPITANSIENQVVIKDLALPVTIFSYKVKNNAGTSYVAGSISFHLIPASIHVFGRKMALPSTNKYLRAGGVTFNDNIPAWCISPYVPNFFRVDLSSYNTKVGNVKITLNGEEYTIYLDNIDMRAVGVANCITKQTGLSACAYNNTNVVIQSPDGAAASAFSFADTDGTGLSLSLITTKAETLPTIVEADGLPMGTKRRGTSLERPSGVYNGFAYFDTTIGKTIYWNGTAWIDGTGAPVANSLIVMSISQTDYDNLGTYDSNTLYVIV